MDYPLSLSSQLVPHLKALRKRRNISQAALGALVGVGQARIADIEANPGLVSVEQMMQILRALGADLVLRTQPPIELPGRIEVGASAAGDLTVGRPPQPGLQRLARTLGYAPESIRAAMADAGQKHGSGMTEDTPLDALTPEQVTQLAQMLGKPPKLLTRLLRDVMLGIEKSKDTALDRPDAKGDW